MTRVGNLALEMGSTPPDPGIGHRGGREQELGIWVERVREHLIACRHLDDPAQVHDRDPVALVTDYRQVMCNEEVGQ
ncbi:MAG: hypothetical protein QF523_07140, partial [Acidimicrobiales bacterium]|nr:hypothetical protein [Acidimicrobiales bacterium]